MNSLMNSVKLIGHVGKEIELKAVGNGHVANFSIATNDTYKNEKGEKITETDWHDCVAWNGLAEKIGKFVTKGTKLAIEGKLKNDNYTTKDGEKRYSTKVQITGFLVLDNFKEGDQE